jgi:uncharacterized protein
MWARRYSLGTVGVMTLFCVSYAAGQTIKDRNTEQLHTPDIKQNVGVIRLSVLMENAREGNPRYQWLLANAYRTGVGAPQNYGEAVRWFKAAAGQNLADAEVALAYLYERGLGIKRDYKAAVHYYQAAALQGDTTAQNNLAFLYESGRGVGKDEAEAIRWYRAAAEAGNPVAHCNLASILYRQKHAQEAARWFRSAAELGVVEAQDLLAVLYYKGEGVSVDYTESARWARMAADSGYPAAQADLAYMYEQGKGVPLDYVNAYAWYSIAATAGERHSAERMRKLAQIMLPEQLKRAKAQAMARADEHPKAASNESPRIDRAISLLLEP